MAVFFFHHFSSMNIRLSQSKPDISNELILNLLFEFDYEIDLEYIFWIIKCFD